MLHSRLRPGFRHAILVISACCLSAWGNRLSAQTPTPPSQTQDAPAKPDSTAVPAPAPATGQSEEVSSHDTPTTFKVRDRKSTRLNSSHSQISYAVFCLKKKTTPRFCPSSQS